MSELETSARQSPGERPPERFSTVRGRSPEEEVRRVLAQSQSAHKRVADLVQLEAAPEDQPPGDQKNVTFNKGFPASTGLKLQVTLEKQ